MKRWSRVRPRTETGKGPNILVKSWHIIAAGTLMAVGGVLGASLAAPPEYRASASIVVNWTRSGHGTIAEATEANRLASLKTLAEIARSRAIAERALEQLGLTGAGRPRALQVFRGLDVRTGGGADLIHIEARGRTPEAASAMANAVADAVLAWHVEARRALASARRRAIEILLIEVSGQLQLAETAWAASRAGGAALSLPERTDLALRQLAKIEAQRRAAAAERESVEVSLRQTRALLGRGTGALAAHAARLDVERQALLARESALGALADGHAQQQRALLPGDVQPAHLIRNLKVAEEIYLVLAQRLQEARIAEASVVGDLAIVDRAVPPMVPAMPRPLVHPLLAVLAGLVLGVAAAYALEAVHAVFTERAQSERQRSPLQAPPQAVQPLHEGAAS